VRVDIHRAYDGAAFMLVPDSDSMQKILDHLLEIEETLEKNPKYYGDVNNLKSYKSVKHSNQIIKMCALNECS
jgi:hypothetical protein